MRDLPETRTSLLLRLRDRADQQAWEEFVRVYERAVYRVARQRGLQDADALDLTQDVLSTVARAIDTWEPGPRRGRFRSWLFTVARNLTVNALARGGRLRGAGDVAIDELLDQSAAEGPESALYQLEYRRQAFAEASRQIRDEVQEATWQAFWLSAVEGLSIEETSRRTRLTVGSVYAARSRILARLRRRVEQLQGQ